MPPDQYKVLLSQFVSFKSVSTDPQFKSEMEGCVAWLVNLFKKNRFEVEVWRGKIGNPVVYASYEVKRQRGEKVKRLETVLIYGHYDVQPVTVEDGWKGDPFKVRQVNGRLFARGIIDNKGQVLIHIYTVLKLIKEKKLKYNVKFLIEGDEETGAGDLGNLIKKNRAKLRVDHVLVSDGEIVGDTPMIEVSLRGGFNLTLIYKTAETNLHSGIYGSAAPNAAHELADFISKLYDADHRVTVPGFYNGVDPIAPEQLKNNAALLKISRAAFAATGIKEFLSEPGYDFYTQTGLRPAIQVTGFKSGYISEGYANIVPATAEARLNFRLVTSQIPEEVIKSFEKFVATKTPKYVEYKISVHGVHFPVKIDISSKKVSEVRELLRLSHGKKPLVRHVGGAIPVVSDFKNVLGVDTLLVPLCNEDCNMHGVEENFDLELLSEGLDFSERFFGGDNHGR